MGSYSLVIHVACISFKGWILLWSTDWLDVLIVGLAKPLRWIINNPESLSSERIKKEEKLVKQLLQINELSYLFVSGIVLCRSTVEILETGEYNQWLEGFIAFLYTGDSISLNFKFGPYLF